LLMGGITRRVMGFSSYNCAYWLPLVTLLSMPHDDRTAANGMINRNFFMISGLIF